MTNGLQTINQIALSRISQDFSQYAKEKVQTELIGSSFYCYGSELAVLRISQKYTAQLLNKSAKVGYSENLKTWYFRLEINIYSVL